MQIHTIPLPTNDQKIKSGIYIFPLDLENALVYRIAVMSPQGTHYLNEFGTHEEVLADAQLTEARWKLPVFEVV